MPIKSFLNIGGTKKVLKYPKDATINKTFKYDDIILLKIF